MLKRLFFLSVMMGMVGLPYLASSSSQWWNSFTSQFSGGSAAGKGSGAGPGANQSGGTSTAQGDRGAGKSFEPMANPRTIEGPAAQNLAEVIQFDGSPAWVMARWPRVTAGLADLDLQGYRVPLVSGTSQDDLAGSLTYYFDKNQRIARIIFHGSTGDPRKLIALVTSRYSFEPQKTDDPSLTLFQAKWNGKPHSELRIRPARVVRANQPYARFEVDLAMKRP
jgi:hypothetical protein